jgi:hypothetical protein
MKSTKEIRPYTPDDFETVINLKLRQADADEITALTQLNVKDSLTQCIKYSKHTWVGLYNGTIECVFGLGEVNSQIGVPWFLSTDKFNEFKIAFGKESKRVVDTMLALYPNLINLIDSRNSVSINWLKWLGFTIEYNHPIDYSGHKFYQFYLNKKGD